MRRILPVRSHTPWLCSEGSAKEGVMVDLSLSV
jgi:hypothetical protein